MPAPLQVHFKAFPLKNQHSHPPEENDRANHRGQWAGASQRGDTGRCFFF
jgi:hypothetical protein